MNAVIQRKNVAKLEILDEYYAKNGMQINESKTKLMAINGTPMDNIPFVMSNVIVKQCKKYVYLGAIFTDDG